MKHLWLFLMITFAGLAVDVRAAEEATVESRLREGLRTVTIQLRDAQNQVATLQATQAASDQKVKELTAKIDALNKQAVADRNTSTNLLAEANTKLAEQTAVNQGLQTAIDKWRRSYTELTNFAQKKEIERAKLNDRVIKLDRQVQDQQIKNIQMYKLGVEILDRYEKFGLGEAVLAREPFVGSTRVKFQNLIQDSQDKLTDQRIKP